MKNKLLFILIFFAVTFNCAHAKNYYFSSTTGNDTRSNVEAQNIATPWQSIQKLNAIMSILLPGDSVLFKRGDTFYGSISANKSGTVGLPIVYNAYGIGAKPVITGFTIVSSWTNKGGNIWESTNAVSTLSTCNMVVINGVNTPMGRTPNTGYYTIATHTLKTSLTSNSLNAGTNWTGAEAVIRTSDWTINRSVVTSQLGNLINFDGTPLNYEIKNGYGFLLQKDIRTLDTLNEWYFNPISKKISVFSSVAPLTLSIASVENIILMNASNVKVENISFTGSNGNAIFRDIKLAPLVNVVIKDCNFNFSGLNAIEVRVNSLQILSNEILNSNDHAISAFYSMNTTISNNTIRNSGLIVGIGLDNDNASSAVTFGAFALSKSIVTNNKIVNTGNNAIIFGIDSAFIAFNRIDSFNLIMDDGGGIYGYGGKNSIISKNIISNGIGAYIGTSRLANNTNIPVSGISLDDNGSKIKIDGNTIFNIGGKGISLHNSWNIDISNNTVYNCGLMQLSVLADVIAGPAGRIRNNSIKNNLFIAKELSQLTVQFASTINDLDSIGVLDSNIYSRPFDNILTINTRRYIGNVLKNDFTDLAGWQKTFGKDTNSKVGAINILPYTLSNIITGNKIANGFFTTTINGVNLTTKTAGSSIIRDATVLDSGSLKCNALENVTMLMNATAISNTKQYVLRFTATATSELNLQIYIIGTPGSQLVKLFPYRKNYELIFSNPSTTTNPTIGFSGLNSPVVFWLDNIVFTEAVATPIPSSNVFDLQFNASTNPVIYNFLGLSKVDVEGNVYNNSVSIPAWGSKVLLANGTFNNPPIANAGADKIVVLPQNTINLTGTGRDVDGFITKYAWAKISGPINETLVNSNSASLTISNLLQGIYLIELTVTDNLGATNKDTVQLIINLPPTANAGSNMAITLPLNISNLVGSGKDSDGTIASFAWVKILGPTEGIIFSPTAANTALSGLVQGLYQFELTVTDNLGAIGKDTIQLIVNSAINSLPTANAGTDAVITLPLNSLNLVGSGKDTDGTVVSFLWVKISGPIVGTISSPTVANTTLSGLVQGVYQFELTVTDNLGAKGKDTVIVTVNAVNTANLLPAVFPINPVSGLDYKYYEGNWTLLPAFNSLQPAKIGTVSNFDISIANRADGFGFSFTGFINVPSDGMYTFYTLSDDGSSLSIDNVLTVSNDGLHGPRELSGTIGLKAGRHAITGLYFQSGSGKVFTVSYQSAGIAKQPIPLSELFRENLLPAVYPLNTVNGLDYKYYEGSWTLLPAFNTFQPVKTGTVSNFDISIANKADGFGFSFTGFINVPSDGMYTFYTLSDDGSSLSIDNVLTVSNDGLHGPRELSGTIGLKAGKHAITGLYFQAGSGKVFTVSYQSAGIAKQPIPLSDLLRISNAPAARGTLGIAPVIITPTNSQKKFNISVYPNPSNGSFNLLIDGANNEKVEFMVFNTFGQIVYRGSGTSNKIYKFGNELPLGIFTIKVLQGNIMKTIKVIKL